MIYSLPNTVFLTKYDIRIVTATKRQRHECFDVQRHHLYFTLTNKHISMNAFFGIGPNHISYKYILKALEISLQDT